MSEEKQIYTPEDMAAGRVDLQAIASGEAIVRSPDPEPVTGDNVLPMELLRTGTLHAFGHSLEDVAAGRVQLKEVSE